MLFLEKKEGRKAIVLKIVAFAALNIILIFRSAAMM
jgi:hypothetical protein